MEKKKQVTHDCFKYASVGEVKSSHMKYTSHWVSQAKPKTNKGQTGYVQYKVLTGELLNGNDWQQMDNLIHTFFPQQEVQEVVGVGHAHFSLHLRPSKGGVDIAWASPLFRLPQLRKPTPHVSVIERRRLKGGRWRNRGGC